VTLYGRDDTQLTIRGIDDTQLISSLV
jgi:hypothetical protein